MKKIIFTFICISAVLLQSCDNKPSLNADQIIDKALHAHGSDLLENSVMEFNFRDIAYKATRNSGIYEFTKTRATDSTIVIDILNNETSKRTINKIPQKIADSTMANYASSVNSVIYFAQLPYSLNGTAVYRKLIGEKIIKNQPYYKIKVTFDPNGGGEDHEDEFIYWIHKETFHIDYLAYSYCEEDCGYRFRESVNRRSLKGVTIQDYNNYKESVQDPDLSQMDQLFIDENLELLSEIKLEEVQITLLK
ncbi:hypothetical protein BST92_11040 [Nonlabens arenilitoris]|uniref:Deoxyribose-phosphate aldolase n=1 Tax=Nonlabens arenilitoris TaxID=1217969 RepID=A0A2S7UCS6_9FLAO|nr:DUF6503 family protein [Nonlabens arenilitoris]PQJ32427.1 hypothetical protein BST92_11040 [Nonlabens arenilitoris]